MTHDSEQVRLFSKPLYQSRHWMRLIGGLLVLCGIALTITGIGVLVAWLPIWLGVLLIMTAKTSRVAHQHGDQPMLVLSLRRLRMAFAVAGVSLILFITGGILFAWYG